jgi:hypothetical protein
LKSPRSGGGNCAIRFVRSAEVIGITGGRYILQRVKQRLGRCTRTAVTCSGEQRLTGIQCMQSFTMTAVPPVPSVRWDGCKGGA